MAKNILVATKGDVTTITLNRIKVHNALNPETIRELRMAIEAEGENKTTCAIVLKGNGATFCSGADINWFRELSQLEIAEAKESLKELPELLLSIYNSPKITIAVTHGSVLGGGIGLAAACDFVVSEQGCRFGFREVKLGIAPATISPFVMIKMDSSVAKGLMLTGEYFDGNKANKAGLVSHLAENGGLEHKLQQLLKEVEGSGNYAVQQIKKMVNDARHQQLILKELEGTTTILAGLIHSEDAQQRMKAFFERKKTETLINT